MNQFPAFYVPSDKNDLNASAQKVLLGNRLNSFTKPAPALYPHQWNWDTGFITLGYMHFDFNQACAEMAALFRGQWSNGMVPQIVFSVLNTGKYFPGYKFWQTRGVANKPRRVRTSGITMPPVHGFVLERMLHHIPDAREYKPFFRKMFEKIVLSHRYCYENRDPEREGLAFICHPWESGMDNLPLWQDVFACFDTDTSAIPPYERRDLDHVDAEFRPRKESYDRYIYLVNLLRCQSYQEPEVWKDYPFQVQEPLFNTMLCQSNQALEAVGEWLRMDTGCLREWHRQTMSAFRQKLWDEQSGMYLAYDRLQKKSIKQYPASGLIPLFCGAPDHTQAESIAQWLNSQAFAGTPETPTFLCPSYSTTDPRFDERRYWRGPVWININWLLYHGLKRYGFEQLARQIRADSFELMQRFGFWEYYNPWKNIPHGAPGGYGSNHFSWTAALAIDWLAEIEP